MVTVNGSEAGWLAPYLIGLFIVTGAAALGPSIVAFIQWAWRRRRAA